MNHVTAGQLLAVQLVELLEWQRDFVRHVAQNRARLVELDAIHRSLAVRADEDLPSIGGTRRRPLSGSRSLPRAGSAGVAGPLVGPRFACRQHMTALSRHDRFHCLLIALFAGLCASAQPARAEDSSFRVTELKPTKNGAKLELAFKNEWGSAATNQENAEVNFYLYDSYADEAALKAASWSSAPFTKPAAKPLGQVTCLGTGIGSIQLDYAKLGLTAGKTVFVQACWVKSTHVWGACQGRETGAWILPEPTAAKAAAKNSGLCFPRLGATPWARAASWAQASRRSTPRWPVRSR